MAGGTWTTQNKVLPGVYTNIVGTGPNPAVTGDRGVCALPVTLPWLPEQTVLELTSADMAQFEADFGDYAIPVRECMKNARLVYLYRLNKGAAAAATLDNLQCTAKFTGSFGNQLTVSVENVVGAADSFYVVTWLDTDELERQTVANIDALEDNDWITFTAVGEEKDLTINAGARLEGGDDGTVTNSDYASFLSAIEVYTYNALGCLSDETDIKSTFVAFTKRMVDEQGVYIQCVVPDSTTADFEAVISVKNGVYLEGGVHIDKATAVAYVTGATAAVSLGESLTNFVYRGAVDVDERFSPAEQEELAKTGQMVFIPAPYGGGDIVIQKDINTLVTFTTKRTYAMSKNKIIRIIYSIAAEINARGNRYFIGKVNNNADGRSLFHANILEFFRELEEQDALQDVEPGHIVVTKGTNIDAVVVTYETHPVDTMDIFYNTINIYA